MVPSPFTRNELKAMVRIGACADLLEDASKLSKGATNQIILADCFDDSYGKATDNCPDEYRALVSCVQAGSTEKKCVELVAKLKDCYSRIAKS